MLTPELTEFSSAIRSVPKPISAHKLTRMARAPQRATRAVLFEANMHVETFLAQLAAERRHHQACSRNPINLSNGFNLDPNLELSIRNSWFISPVFAQALFPPRAACVGVPANDPEQISYWAALYGDTCNWGLFPSPQCPVLEINLSLARHSLEWIAHQDGWDWRRTLRFRAGNLWFAMLRPPSGEIRLRATRLPGLRLLSNTNSSLLVPPSQILGESRLEYDDLVSRPAEAPASLFAPGIGEEPLDHGRH